MSIYSLNAISPIDGRYYTKTKVLSNYFSESSLIRYRVKVEIEYFISLCELPLALPYGFIGLYEEAFQSNIPISKRQSTLKRLAI